MASNIIAGFKGAETKHTARMRGAGLKKLQTDREAREREARQLAQEIEADDDERERVRLVLEAWENLEVLRVNASECDFLKPVPVDCHGHVRWPVKLEVADKTDPTLVALQRHVDIKKILTAGRRAMRTLRVPVTSVTHADRTEAWGLSAVAFCIGCEDDGTPAKCLALQKTLNFLHDLGGDYAGSTTLQCGLQGTLGMQHCFVIPVALVKAEDRCLGEGGLYGAVAHSTGVQYLGQCSPPGAPDVWAPDVLDVVLKDEDHPLHEYALAGVAPPMMAPKAREEMSSLIKEGKKNMSAAAKKREEAGRKQSGVGLPGKENYSTKKDTEQISRNGSYKHFLFCFEALQCVQHKRKPASWAKGKLTATMLKRLAKAGLADEDFGPCFVTTLKEEKSKGRQLFCIEGFKATKPASARGAHIWDFIIETQRGPFPVYDVNVALGLFRENEMPPELPWTRPRFAPAEVKALIEQALAWSPPASEPSPPPAKKPRAAAKGPRRSTRLKK